MKKILIITTADMSLQSGNVVLINRRAEEIFKQFHVKTTCLVLGHENAKINHKVEGIEYLTISSKQQIKTFIEHNRPSCVIFYGALSYKQIPYVKKIATNLSYKPKILLDIQGALEEGIEYSKGIRWFVNYTKYLLKRSLLSKSLNMADGAFVVSDELQEYCLSFLKRKKSTFKVFKIRCGINEVINNNQKMEWRKEIRNQWNINDDTVVMVFSGYRMPWQNIDKIIECFKQYDSKMENVFFAFYCNIDQEFEERIRNTFKKGNYKLKFLSFDEYFKYLCACDIGFLIRDKNVTNKVAFPNKFSDYLNAGLTVAMNNALPEPYRILDQNNVKYIDIDEKMDNHIEIFNERLSNILEAYERTYSVCKTELLYSRQIANMDFENFIK
ncbi:hypothetical protein ACU3L3_07790 [Priestia endophytica]